ncbi:maleylacetate reductase [Streptomyces sp. Ag109_O5-10]|uniref:maleylacetate reductase n=1 Tax=Streptomyces sp. Ag109_O5-10 TaxID=1855349 RepID=UPI00089D74C2|nr:maleylacetate reductase [Streptomyces sp. Ag109_O5-10]SEE47994.1 Alcohol dehydrogenase, class IV [Streptomyces sp. Ag109_O5-10]
MRFDHETLPQRVRFASGAAAAGLAAEVELLGGLRPMVIADPAARAVAREIAAGLPVAHWHDRDGDVVMHVPVAVAERARAAAAEHDVDVLVAVGGGSTTGLAKAVALTSGIPVVAVPTTYAGSEATAVWGLTADARKTTGTDPRVLPRAVVYDAALTLSLPVGMSVASGLNALAHCVDSMWAPRTDPIDQALAAEGVRALRTGLPLIVKEPAGLDGRERALYGAYLSATAFASAGSGLHHKICHVLGGMFDLPHAQTHAVVLPHVLAFNAPHAPEAERRLAAAFDAPTATTGLALLYDELDPPRALRDLGMPEDGITPAAEAIVAAAPPDNPRAVALEPVLRLVRAAWEGARP